MAPANRLEHNEPSSSLAGSSAPASSRPACSTTFERRLLAYALGSGAVALSSTVAEAEIIWSGVQNIDVSSTGLGNNNTVTGLHVDVTDNASPTFNFGWYNTATYWGVALIGDAQPGNAVDFGLVPNRTTYLQNNSSGTLIPPTHFVSSTGGFAATYDFKYGTGAWQAESYWAAGGTGYVSFNFQDSNPLVVNNYYGWMEVNVPTDGTPGQTARLVQWAFESTPNTPIAAGATISVVPEVLPNGIATAVAFAFGARGVRAWRRRRQPAA